MTAVKTRVAPSPTGDPHVGTAYVALVNLCLAKKSGGSFVLRIEDTDRVRSTIESERAILKSLQWLGLQWDGDPFRQSERTHIYETHVDQLLKSGGAFRCFCSAERLEEMRVAQRAAKMPPRYDGLCLSLTEDEIRHRMDAGVAHVVRLRVPSEGSCVFDDVLRGRIEFEWKTVDMQVLMKSDGFPTYHLANVVDDHAMGITHVVRGEEWISSAPKHLLLYQYFGWDAPQLCHLPLLRNPDKSKLSKRKNPTSILYYREQGYLAEALLHFLGMLIDTRNDDTLVEKARGTDALIEAMTARFALEHISLGGPVFDLAKLNWLNGQHIRAKSVDEFLHVLHDFGYRWPESVPQSRREHIARVAQPRIEKLTDFAPLVAFFDEMPDLSKSDFDLPKISPPEVRDALQAAEETLVPTDGTWDAAFVGERLKAAATQTGKKFKDVARVYYLAITGSPASVPLFDAIEILGKTETLRRLRLALEILQ
ncbi:MAG TPA: glutamate--tRNA ligase [Candidatus Baltobacteraceae bacterium]|nr:glutamate--tRNA ligase [Candidatus Baltobacteraceae bacterium]